MDDPVEVRPRFVAEPQAEEPHRVTELSQDNGASRGLFTTLCENKMIVFFVVIAILAAGAVAIYFRSTTPAQKHSTHTDSSGVASSSAGTSMSTPAGASTSASMSTSTGASAGGAANAKPTPKGKTKEELLALLRETQSAPTKTTHDETPSDVPNDTPNDTAETMPGDVGDDSIAELLCAGCAEPQIEDLGDADQSKSAADEPTDVGCTATTVSGAKCKNRAHIGDKCRLHCGKL